LPGERLYLETETNTDVAARHVNRYKHAIELAGITGGRWVDFACGSGYGTAMIAEVADSVIGIDASADAVQYARDRYPGCTFWWGALAGLRDALARGVDIVVCIETLEHLPPFEQRSLVRLVKDSGAKLVLACPIGDGPNPANPWHVHEPTEPELRELLAVFGSRTLETEEYESTSGPAVQAWAVAQ
jgi:2-polyprenyl-3-methyl-5-hydroxy-6-metoxy-1,4-benzoquinol methylase